MSSSTEGASICRRRVLFAVPLVLLVALPDALGAAVVVVVVVAGTKTCVTFVSPAVAPVRLSARACFTTVWKSKAVCGTTAELVERASNVILDGVTTMISRTPTTTWLKPPVVVVVVVVVRALEDSVALLEDPEVPDEPELDEDDELEPELEPELLELHEGVEKVPALQVKSPLLV
jgi:hypothetical protein